jgi:hypothetical protein
VVAARTLDIEARHHLRRLVIEIQRALARGNDPEARIARELVDFSKAGLADVETTAFA